MHSVPTPIRLNVPCSIEKDGCLLQNVDLRFDARQIMAKNFEQTVDFH